jgi:hypothetical protein
MKLTGSFLMAAMLFIMLNLFGSMHYTLERGMDFGSKDLDNVLPLSDGKFVSFGMLDVNVFEIENDSLRFDQRLYSPQYYASARAFGTDSLYAITQGNILDVYAYNHIEGLSLLHSYLLASDDSLSISSEVKFLGDGFILVGAYTDLVNFDASYCQSIYQLNGAAAPTLVSISYGNYLNRFTQIEHINQQYYYFGSDGSMYVSPELTNQPQLVICPDLAGQHFYDTKVIQGGLYVLSADAASHAKLSKLEPMVEGNVETAWMQSLGTMEYPTFSNISNGFVHIVSPIGISSTKVARYSFSDSLTWQFVISRSFAWDNYTLCTFHNGYALFGNARSSLLSDILMPETTLMAAESWWCKQVFLNRFMLLQNDVNWNYKLLDLETGQFLNFTSYGDYFNCVFRQGENKLIFTGNQIEMAILNEDGITGFLTFTNELGWPKGSAFNDKILISGSLEGVESLTLYRNLGDTVEQLNNLGFEHMVEAIQFYDAAHFAILENNGDYTTTLRLYRIDEDNSFSLIASYPSNGFSIYVNRNKITAQAINGLVLDVSDPDNPVEVPHDNRYDFSGLSFNGMHNYMSSGTNITNIFDDNFQYAGYIDNYNAHFVGENKVVIASQTCAVIVTMDDIVSNPPEENLPVIMPELMLSNAPNPFVSDTAISFTLTKSANVNLAVYNLKGQKVVQLNDKKLAKGEHKLYWDGRDSNHKKVSSGLYFARLSTGKTSSTRKIIMMK